MIIDREEKRVKLIKTDPDFTHKGEKGDTVPMHAGTARQKTLAVFVILSFSGVHHSVFHGPVALLSNTPKPYSGKKRVTVF